MKKKTLKRKVKLYWVDWYNSCGICYRSTTDCTWADVLQCRKTARLLGETIKYEHYRTVEYDYSV